MKHLLITSMLALSVGCGAAVAQTESAQPGAGGNCASGQADCQKGGKAGAQVQGKMKSETNQNAQGENAQGKAKVKTDQQAQGQTGTDQNAQDNNQLKKKQQAQGKAKNGTEQNAQGVTKMQTNDQAQGKAGAGTEQNAQGDTQLKKKNQQAQGKTGTDTGQSAQGGNKVDQSKTASITNVTVEQKTQVTQIFHETRVEPVRDVNFDISVGIEVPRHRIHLHRLPSRIVEIVPAYEGYEYFVLADGRIVIVDPDSYRIVLILT